MKSLYVLFVFALSTVANQAAGGEIGYSYIHNYMDYNPSCYKPSEPSFFVHDLHSYNSAVDDYNDYLDDVKIYLSCLVSEGEADIRLLRQAVANGVDEKRTEILDELDSLRSDLERERSTLD